MRRRRMFPETSLYVANYILSKPRVNIYDSRRNQYSERVRVVLESFRTPRLGLKDYWLSPQRSHLSGTTWRTSQRQLMILPGNTGVSDVHSSLYPSCCRLHHPLVWKYHWQKLNEHLRRVRY